MTPAAPPGDCAPSRRGALPEGVAAPEFEAESTRGPFRLSQWRGRCKGVLLFYPLAFTPVCSAELPLFEAARPRFEEDGADIVAISVDSLPSARAFAATLGLRELGLVADLDMRIAGSYGVLREEGFAERATFVLDKEGIIRAVRISDLMVKRDPSAILELVNAIDALAPGGEDARAS
ncbi:MAG: redoxin domain-containing protein [Planctomycetota bacterium]